MNQTVRSSALTIAVGVLEIQDVRRAGDDQPALPRHDAVGKRQSVGEIGALLEAAVAVGVLEHRDPPRRRLAFCRAGRIAAILGDEQSPALVEGHRHGTVDERLGGDQLDAQARGKLKRVERLLR